MYQLSVARARGGEAVDGGPRSGGATVGVARLVSGSGELACVGKQR